MVTLIILFLILISLFILIYFLSSAEFVFFSLSADELRELSSSETTGAHWLSERLKRPRELALFFIVSRTFAIVGSAVILIFISLSTEGVIVPILGGLLLWVFIMVFGFAVPESLAQKNKLAHALVLAPSIRVLRIIFYPIVIFWKYVLRMIAPESGFSSPLAIEREFRDIIPDKEGFASLETEEKEMIRHVVEFGDTTVREVMVPRIDMACISISSPSEAAVKIISEAGHSRIPLYSGRIDNIVGILYAKDLLIAMSKGEKPTDLNKIARAPYYVPEAKKIADLLREFRKEHIHIAIVVDEYGGTAGLVTIEDLLEEIVGEIQDEYDKEEIPIRKISENAFVVEARLPIDEVNDALGISLPEDEVETLAGLIYSLTGSIPKPGEKLEYGNLIFVVESVIGQRVRHVKIILKKEETE